MFVSKPIALSQDKPRATETGLNYRQGEAVVSTDLPSRAKIMTEFVDSCKKLEAWKKIELQQWLKNHGLKVSGTKEELEARVENAKQAGLTLVSFAALFWDVTQRSPQKKRLLTTEQHSFPLFDQSQLLFHFREPFRAKFAI